MMVELLERATTATAVEVREVSRHYYDALTPCAGWDVRDLLNHMIGGNYYFAGSVAGSAPDMGVWSRDYVADGEPAKLYEETARAALDAFTAPGALERTATMPTGKPGPRLADMFLMEQVLHGWDLASALGDDRTGDPVVVQAVYDGWYGKVPAEIRALGTVFGPEQPCPDTAPLADRLAAYLGRPVLLPG